MVLSLASIKSPVRTTSLVILDSPQPDPSRCWGIPLDPETFDDWNSLAERANTPQFTSIEQRLETPTDREPLLNLKVSSKVSAPLSFVQPSGPIAMSSTADTPLPSHPASRASPLGARSLNVTAVAPEAEASLAVNNDNSVNDQTTQAPDGQGQQVQEGNTGADVDDQPLDGYQVDHGAKAVDTTSPDAAPVGGVEANNSTQVERVTEAPATAVTDFTLPAPPPGFKDTLSNRVSAMMCLSADQHPVTEDAKPAFVTAGAIGWNLSLSDTDKAYIVLNYPRRQPHEKAPEWTIEYALGKIGAPEEDVIKPILDIVAAVPAGEEIPAVNIRAVLDDWTKKRFASNTAASLSKEGDGEQASHGLSPASALNPATGNAGSIAKKPAPTVAPKSVPVPTKPISAATKPAPVAPNSAHVSNGSSPSVPAVTKGVPSTNVTKSGSTSGSGGAKTGASSPANNNKLPPATTGPSLAPTNRPSTTTGASAQASIQGRPTQTSGQVTSDPRGQQAPSAGQSHPQVPPMTASSEGPHVNGGAKPTPTNGVTGRTQPKQGPAASGGQGGQPVLPIGALPAQTETKPSTTPGSTSGQLLSISTVVPLNDATITILQCGNSADTLVAGSAPVDGGASASNDGAAAAVMYRPIFLKPAPDTYYWSIDDEKSATPYRKELIKTCFAMWTKSTRLVFEQASLDQQADVKFCFVGNYGPLDPDQRSSTGWKGGRVTITVRGCGLTEEDNRKYDAKVRSSVQQIDGITLTAHLLVIRTICHEVSMS